MATRKVTFKKKAASKKKSLVNFVLDETGSMQICKEATISGFNEYIKSLQSQKGGAVDFTLTKFNSIKIDVVHKAVPLSKVCKINADTYLPDMMTPLYDAIAAAINAADTKKYKKILCVIMTDGEENASKEYTRDKIFNLIKEKEKENWTFVYLGANQDSWEVGQAIGLKKGNVINYDVGKTEKTYHHMSNGSAKFLNSNASNTGSFFADAHIKEEDIK